MKNDTKANVLAELRQREQRDRASAVATYREAVLAIARGEDVDADDIAEAMAGAGHTSSEFAAHVALARRLDTERSKVIERDDYHERLEAAGEALREFNAERERILDELAKRQRELEAKPGSIRAERLLADRQAAKVEQLSAELEAAVAGQPKPEPEATSKPTMEVSYGAAPQSKRPANYDAFDPRWEMRYETAGVVHYYFNGKRVSA